MVMFPDGDRPEDDDEVTPGIGLMRPALPSRATGEEKPLTPLPETEEAPRRRRQKRTERLPAPEIKRINQNRKKNMRNNAKRVPRSKTVLKEKAPNRPLELKNRLHTVLAAVKSMTHAEEITAFAELMAHLEGMSAPARRRVIAALEQVYA